MRRGFEVVTRRRAADREYLVPYDRMTRLDRPVLLRVARTTFRVYMR